MVEWPMVSFVATMAGGYPSARIAIPKNTNSCSCMRSLLGFNDAEIDALLLLHRNPPVGAHRPERIVGDFPNVPVGIAKITGVTAPEGLVRRLEDICVVSRLQACEDGVDLGFAARVVGEGGAAVGGIRVGRHRQRRARPD